MKFRPCIDLHNGKVKQIVGSSLNDAENSASENFVSDRDAAFFARLFREKGLDGGHVILLNRKDSPYYEATRAQALSALAAYPQGLMAGGGITPESAEEYLAAGASAVIVTSYVFRDGRIDVPNLLEMEHAAGREHLVLDLSCRKTERGYRVMTDRWQKATDTDLSAELFASLSGHCAEFLIHAIDVEGKNRGIDEELIRLLAEWSPCPVTYAGGVSSYEDLEAIRRAGDGRVDVTVGSALSIYGGHLDLERCAFSCKGNPLTV